MMHCFYRGPSALIRNNAMQNADISREKSQTYVQNHTDTFSTLNYRGTKRERKKERERERDKERERERE